MTRFVAFDDERLDANLASILDLPDRPAPEAAAPTLSRMRASRRASVTTVVALVLALGGGVALLIGRGAMPGDAVRTDKDVRHVIDLSGAAPIPRPPVPAATPSDTAAPVPGLGSRRRSPRRPARIAVVAEPPIVAPSPAATGAAPVALAAEAPARSVAAANAAIIAAIDAPRAPSATPAPPPAPVDAATATRRDRRDSVDAIRSLRRQW